jgi:Cns1/TTC4 Wheel domain
MHSRNSKDDPHACDKQERNIIEIPNPDGSSNPYGPHFDPEDPAGNALIFPVFFLYPQHATSDVISHFFEDTAFSAHLSEMFPPKGAAPEWDNNGEYVDGQLVIYAMTYRKRLLKIGKKMTLKDVCLAAKEKEGDPKDGLEMKDRCLTFVVLPKGDVMKKWVDEFKLTSRDS